MNAYLVLLEIAMALVMFHQLLSEIHQINFDLTREIAVIESVTLTQKEHDLLRLWAIRKNLSRDDLRKEVERTFPMMEVMVKINSEPFVEIEGEQEKQWRRCAVSSSVEVLVPERRTLSITVFRGCNNDTISTIK
jgi:hypothetical protein